MLSGIVTVFVTPVFDWRAKRSFADNCVPKLVRRGGLGTSEKKNNSQDLLPQIVSGY